MDSSATDMESSQEELVATSRAQDLLTKHKHRYTFVFIAGLLLMCGAAISFWHYPRSSARIQPESIIEEVLVDAECAHLPFVKLDSVVSSNLAKQGPDTDAEEGIIYKATANVGNNIPNLRIHVHSISSFDVSEDDTEGYDREYKPAFERGEFSNGMHGDFACVNVKPGGSVKLRIEAYDADKKKHISLSHGVISFFDFDKGPKSIERLTVPELKTYYVTNGTEIDIAKEGQATVFSGTKEATGDDNPHDPFELTPKQEEKAVTIEFKGTRSYFDFEIEATAGNTPGRVFLFILRPILLCAHIKMPDGSVLKTDSQKKPEVVVPGAASDNQPLAGLMFACLAILIQSLL